MTNKHTHHFAEPVFSRQSDTPIVHILPASGIVHAYQRTNGLSHARQTRINPLDVDGLDISRDSARLTAHPAERRRDSVSTHLRLSESNGTLALHQRRVVTLIEFDLKVHIASRTNTKRPVAQAHTQTSEGPGERGVPADPDSAHSPQKLAERPLGV